MCDYIFFQPTSIAFFFFFRRYFFLAVQLHGAFVDSCWTNLLPVWHLMFWVFLTFDTKHRETRNLEYCIFCIQKKRRKLEKAIVVQYYFKFFLILSWHLFVNRQQCGTRREAWSWWVLPFASVPGGGKGATQGRLWPPLQWPQKTWYVWELSF